MTWWMDDGGGMSDRVSDRRRDDEYRAVIDLQRQLNDCRARLAAAENGLVERQSERDGAEMYVEQLKAKLQAAEARCGRLRDLVMQVLESEDFSTKNPSWSARADAALAAEG